ncbi:MAG: OmpA family protein [Oscillospiraceae bacterium]|nr:OmpA family protein [Oscillospiraceae bacterium]
MSRRKIARRCDLGSQWLHAYAGTVTILLAVLLLLVSMSTLDIYRFNTLVSQLMHASGTSVKIAANAADAAPVTPGLRELSENIEKHILKAGLENAARVSYGHGYVFVRFSGDTLFEPDTAVLNRQGREILQVIGEDIPAFMESYAAVSIHGHTASIPDGAGYGVSDRMFSAQRANAVLAVLEDTAAAPDHLFAIGWGGARPIAGRGNSRRIEILISAKDLQGEQLDNIYAKLVE